MVLYNRSSKGEESKEPAIRLLSKLFSQNMSKTEKKTMLSEEFGIEVTEKISREVAAVCNLSEGIYKRGMAEGRLTTLCNAVKNVMESFHVSLEEALKVLNVNGEDRTLLMKML